jgi:hypothetical protein
MWQDKPGRVGNQLAIEQQIQIERACGPSLTSHATRLCFDLVQAGQQGLGRQRRFQQDCGVQEGGLIRRSTDGERFMPGALGKQRNIIVAGQKVQGALEARVTVAQVGAKADKCLRHRDPRTVGR